MSFFHLLFPPRCLSCQAFVSEPDTLCHECFSDMAFYTPHSCAICADPLPITKKNTALCGLCSQKAPAYRILRPVFYYNEPGRRLIHRFKYHDATSSAPALASWMMRSGRTLLSDCNLLIPVPLHRYRLWKRRYNQVALLTQHLSAASSLPVLSNGLKRKVNTKPQSGLSYAERQANLQHAFSFSPRYSTLIQDRHILLVDDVVTTGATVQTCAKLLCDSGAASVSVLSLAKKILE